MSDTPRTRHYFLLRQQYYQRRQGILDKAILDRLADEFAELLQREGYSPDEVLTMEREHYQELLGSLNDLKDEDE